MAQTKPLSEMSKDELIQMLDAAFNDAYQSPTVNYSTFCMTSCLVLIGMLQLKTKG